MKDSKSSVTFRWLAGLSGKMHRLIICLLVCSWLIFITENYEVEAGILRLNNRKQSNKIVCLMLVLTQMSSGAKSCESENESF